MEKLHAKRIAVAAAARERERERYACAVAVARFFLGSHTRAPYVIAACIYIPIHYTLREFIHAIVYVYIWYIDLKSLLSRVGESRVALGDRCYSTNRYRTRRVSHLVVCYSHPRTHLYRSM